jgi:hypothetical protein
MADTAAFCVDYLFPQVPARQYVLSLPYALRFKMAYSADATTVVLGAFISAINSDLRRRARKRKLRGRLQTGSLTVVQRFGSSLNLNVHYAECRIMWSADDRGCGPRREKSSSAA